MNRHPNLLNRNKTALIIIDIQERLARVMNKRETVVGNTVKLIRGFKILNAPVFYTEQYPKGLGGTDPAILQHLDFIEPFVKAGFSVCSSEEFLQKINMTGVNQLVLAGMETHVCVLQSALDFLQAGFQVYVAADCVCSRKEFDYATALKRLTQKGVTITSTETVLFELMQEAGSDKFKSISQIIK